MHTTLDWLHISGIFNRESVLSLLQLLLLNINLLSQFRNMKVLVCRFSPRIRRQIESCLRGYTVQEGREDVV